MDIAAGEEHRHYIVVERAAVGHLKVLRHCRGHLGSREMRYKQNLAVGQLGSHTRRSRVLVDWSRCFEVGDQSELGVGGTGWEVANLFVEVRALNWKVCEELGLSGDIGVALVLAETLGEVAAVAAVRQHRMGLVQFAEAAEDTLGERWIGVDNLPRSVFSSGDSLCISYLAVD